MLIAEIVVSVIAVLLVIFPKFFLYLKSPRSTKKIHDNKKILLAVRAWGIICLVIGIILILISIV